MILGKQLTLQCCHQKAIPLGHTLLGHTASNSGFPHFFQVVVVAGIIGVTTILAFLAQPVINNIVNAFPHAS